MKNNKLIFYLIILFYSSKLVAQVSDTSKIIFEDAVETSTPKKQQEIVIEDTVYKIKSKAHRFLIVENEGKYGLIKDKQIVLHAYIDGYIKEEYYGFSFKHDQLVGILDKNGQELVPAQYKSAGFIGHKIIGVTTTEGKRGIFEIGRGMILKPDLCELRGMYDPDERLYSISRDCKNYALHHLDSTLLETDFKYQYIANLGNPELIAVKRNNLFGLLDFQGNEVVPIKYNKLKAKKTYLLAQKNHIYGFIDYQDSVIVDFKYNYIEEAQSGTYIANYKGRYGVMDIDENILIPFEYDHIYLSLYDKGGYTVTKNNLEGILSFENKMIVQPNYTSIKALYEVHDNKPSIAGYYVMDINSKWGLLDSRGNQILDQIFDDISRTRADAPLQVKIKEHDFTINYQGECIQDCPDENTLRDLGIKLH